MTTGVAGFVSGTVAGDVCGAVGLSTPLATTTGIVGFVSGTVAGKGGNGVVTANGLLAGGAVGGKEGNVGKGFRHDERFAFG